MEAMSAVVSTAVDSISSKDVVFAPAKFSSGATKAAIEKGLFAHSIPHPSDIITTPTLEGASHHADLKIAELLGDLVTPSLSEIKDATYWEGKNTDRQQRIRMSDVQMNFVLKALATFRERIWIKEDGVVSGAGFGSDRFSYQGYYRKGFMISGGMGLGKTLMAMVLGKEVMAYPMDVLYLTYGQAGFLDPTHVNTANMLGIKGRACGYSEIAKALKKKEETGNPIFAELSYGAIVPTQAQQKEGLPLNKKFMDLFPNGFTGLVICDEFHRAAGMEKRISGKGKEKKILIVPKSARAAALFALQRLSPEAPFLYMSGTALKEPSSILSARRLGLAEKNFAGDVNEMNKKLIDADPSLLELVAQTLVHDGVMEHAALSMEGVESDTLEFEPTQKQCKYFEEASPIVVEIRNHLEYKTTQNVMVPPQQRMASMIQDFYVALSSSTLMEHVIHRIRRDVADGFGPGVYTENTYESHSRRLLAYDNYVAPDTHESATPFGYKEIDMKNVQGTPKAMLIDWILNPENFPINRDCIPVFMPQHLNPEGTAVAAYDNAKIHMAKNWYEVPHHRDFETTVRLSPEIQQLLRKKHRATEADQFFIVVAAFTEYDKDTARKVCSACSSSGDEAAHLGMSMQLRDDIIDRITKLDMPMYPADLLRFTMKRDNIELVELTGRTAFWDGDTYLPLPEGTNKKEKIAKFQDGEAQAFLLNQTASTGVTLKHANGEPPNRRRHLYIVNIGERADNALQSFFRVHRTDQQTAPKIYLGMVGKTGLRFVASIMDAAQTLLALSAGDSQSSGLDFMNNPEYDLMDSFANASFKMWLYSKGQNYKEQLNVIPNVWTPAFEFRQFLNYMPMLSAVVPHTETETIAQEIIDFVVAAREKAIEEGELADTAVIRAGTNGVAAIEEKAVIPMTDSIELAKLNILRHYRPNKKRIGKRNMAELIRHRQNRLIIAGSQIALHERGVVNMPARYPAARLYEAAWLFPTARNQDPSDSRKAHGYWDIMVRRAQQSYEDYNLEPATATPTTDEAATVPVWRYLAPDKKTAFIAYFWFVIPSGHRGGNVRKMMSQALDGYRDTKTGEVTGHFRPVFRLESPKGETKDFDLPADINLADGKLLTLISNLNNPEKNIAITDPETFQQAWDADVNVGGMTQEDMYVLRGDLMENLSEVLETGKHDFAQIVYGDQHYLAKRLNFVVLRSQKPTVAQQLTQSTLLADRLELSPGPYKGPDIPTLQVGSRYTMKGNFILNHGQELYMQYSENRGGWVLEDYVKGSIHLPNTFEFDEDGSPFTKDKEAAQRLISNAGWTRITESGVPKLSSFSKTGRIFD